MNKLHFSTSLEGVWKVDYMSMKTEVSIRCLLWKLYDECVGGVN